MKRKYMLKKIISLIFALTLIAMLATTAVAMETRASKLIISHSCVASADADGEINVTFSITGKGIMSRIGAQSMYFYVKSGSAWTLEKSYGQYSAGMNTTNKVTYDNTITYQELICKGWFLPPNTYDCGSFVVNGTAVVGKEPKKAL